MKVRAKFSNNKFGFYAGNRIRNGQVFTLHDKSDFSEHWMVKLEEDEKPARRGRPKKAEEAEGDGGE